MSTFDLARLYRRIIDPRARRTASTAIIHSGGKRTIHGCVCGSTHTEAARYRYQSRHYQDWRASHKSCMAEAVGRALPGTMACFAGAVL